MYFADRSAHAIPFFLIRKIVSLNSLYYKLLAEMMHDVSNDRVPPNRKDSFLPPKKVHSYNTRSLVSNNFYILRPKLEIKRQSFSRASVKLWNELPTKFRVLPKTLFKKQIKIVLFNTLKSEDFFDDFESLVTKVKSQLSKLYISVLSFLSFLHYFTFCSSFIPCLPLKKLKTVLLLLRYFSPPKNLSLFSYL